MKLQKFMAITNFRGALAALTFAVFGLAASTGAHAGVITSLYSTGVDNSGNLLANGAVDSHYSVTPGNGPYVIGNPAGVGWIGNTAGSQWISAAANTYAGPGPFTYTTTFDLTGFDYTTALIAGLIASDNMAAIRLNGNLVDTSPFGNWSFFHNFSISSGFIAGVNTLTFTVPNNQQTANDGPTGLQVDIRSATATTVPEPASLALLGLGLAGLGFARRRKV